MPFCRDALVANSLVQLLAKGAQTRIAVNHLLLRLLTGRALKTWAKQKGIAITDNGCTVPDPKVRRPKDLLDSEKRVPTVYNGWK